MSRCQNFSPNLRDDSAERLTVTACGVYIRYGALALSDCYASASLRGKVS